MLILVVDDEPQIRKLLATGLGGYGHDVLTAATGEQALTLVAQRKPDLVVLDINLGREPDGLEVCRRLREWSRVPIIILSVHGDETTKVRALDAGAGEQLAPPAGGIGVRHVDGFAVERETPGAQPGDRDEIAETVSVNLEEKVLALLSDHDRPPCR